MGLKSIWGKLKSSKRTVVTKTKALKRRAGDAKRKTHRAASKSTHSYIEKRLTFEEKLAKANKIFE